MSGGFDEKWLRDYIAKGGKVTDSRTGQPITGNCTTNKYNARKTESRGIKFDSKHEANMYEQLRLRCLAGEFSGLGLQVPFYLPGGVKYYADFVAFLPGGGYIVYDAKSEATRKDKTYRLKRRLMKACLNIDIQEV